MICLTKQTIYHMHAHLYTHTHIHIQMPARINEHCMGLPYMCKYSCIVGLSIHIYFTSCINALECVLLLLYAMNQQFNILKDIINI